MRDVDLRQKIVYIYNSKSRKSRKVDINEWLVETLIKLRKHPESSYVFYNKDGKPYGDIKKSFENAKRRADIKDFRFLDLRHTFASHWVMAGVDLKTV
jgi:integrase